MGTRKRFVSLVPFILLLSWAGCAARRDVAGWRFVEEKDFPLEVKRSLSWNGNWVAETEAGFQVLDVSAASMHPLQVPGLDSLLALADAPGGPTWALGKVGNRLRLVRGRGSSFEEQPLPENLSDPENEHGWSLLAESHTLVLVDGKRESLRALQGGTWRTLPFKIPGPPEGPMPFWSLAFARLLLRGSTIYVGFSAGEWGGGLYTLSLESGEQKPLCLEEDLPIAGLVSAPDGHVWFAAGLAHLGFEGGRLWRLDEKGCTLVTDTEHTDRGENPWNLGATPFEGLAFDSHGEPHVLTWEAGVVRHQGKEWTSETPDWAARTSDFGFRTEHYIVPFYVHALALEGETSLIGTNAGLLLWKLGTPELHQVLVPGSRKPPSKR